MYTKGEWVTGKTKFWEQCIYHKESGYLVAKAINRKREAEAINENDEETLSNARIIAAAPDLLEALKFILNDCPIQGEDAVLSVNGYNKACNAIAKAEGR